MGANAENRSDVSAYLCVDVAVRSRQNGRVYRPRYGRLSLGVSVRQFVGAALVQSTNNISYRRGDYRLFE